MTYGTGTRSYNRSAEKREMDRQRAEATAAYVPRPESIIIGPICNCLSFKEAHQLSAHKTLRNEMDWRPWQERGITRYEP